MNLDCLNWTAISAIATAAAAGVTAWMAWMTRKSVEQSHTHHLDAFRPLITLMPYDGIDPPNRKSLVAFGERDRVDENMRHLELRGALQNIGLGPALNLRLRVAVMNPDDFRIAAELSPMHAGEFRKGPQYDVGGQLPLIIPVHLSAGFNDTDFQMAPNSPWTIYLEYEDVFGQRFRTCHASNPQLPWTTTGTWQQDHWTPA